MASTRRSASTCAATFRWASASAVDSTRARSSVSHRATLPIRQIVQAARSIIDTGKLDARVPARPSHDELDQLAQLRQFGRTFWVTSGAAYL